MDRTPGQNTGGFKRSIKPEFDRATKPELIRKEEITVKQLRIQEKMKSFHEKHVAEGYLEQMKTPYTTDDVAKLAQPEYVPDWGKSADPIVGAPKSPHHAQKLAEINEQPRTDKRIKRVQETAKSMVKAQRPLGNGIIAGTKRGGSNRRFD